MKKSLKILSVILALTLVVAAVLTFYSKFTNKNFGDTYAKQREKCSEAYIAKYAMTEIKSFEQISIDHGSCLYICQEYKVVIKGSGQVNYKGSNPFVRMQGEASASLTPDQITDLTKLINISGFLSIPKDTYKNCGDGNYEGQGIWISVKAEGEENALGFAGQPPQLMQFAKDVEKIVNVNQWTGTLEEMTRELRPETKQ